MGSEVVRVKREQPGSQAWRCPRGPVLCGTEGTLVAGLEARSMLIQTGQRASSARLKGQALGPAHLGHALTGHCVANGEIARGRNVGLLQEA